MVTPPHVSNDHRYQLFGTYAKEPYAPVSREIDRLRGMEDLSGARRWLDKARQDYPARPDLWEKHEQEIREAQARMISRKLDRFLQQATARSANEKHVTLTPLVDVQLGLVKGYYGTHITLFFVYKNERGGLRRVELCDVRTPFSYQDSPWRGKLDEMQKLWDAGQRSAEYDSRSSKTHNRSPQSAELHDLDVHGLRQEILNNWDLELTPMTKSQRKSIRKMGGTGATEIPPKLVRKSSQKPVACRSSSAGSRTASQSSSSNSAPTRRIRSFINRMRPS